MNKVDFQQVIYVLNTKNDDNEAMINVLKSQPKEMRKIIDETNDRVELLKEKLNNHLADDRKIIELQKSIRFYEKSLNDTKEVSVYCFKVFFGYC